MQLARPCVTMLTVLIVLLAAMLASCTPTPTPPPAAVVTLQVQAKPSATLIPIATAPIVATDTLSATPGPGASARPSPTAPPTAAPVVPTAIPPTAPAPTRQSALPADPRAAISQAMRAQLKAMPFSVLSEITSGATTIKTFVEFESLQRVRVTTISGSSVLYDGKYYVKEGQAAWREDSRGAAAITGFLAGMLDAAGVEAFIKMIKTAKQVGSETLDGIPCRIYEYTYAGEQFGVQTSGKAQMWVAEDDALPIKQVTESETAGYKATSTQSFDYGPDLKVEVPITG